MHEGEIPAGTIEGMSPGDVAEFLEVASNEVRLEILLSVEEAPILTSTLSEALGLDRLAISAHIAILKRSGLIEARRVGRTADYSVTGRGRWCLAMLRPLLDKVDRS